MIHITGIKFQTQIIQTGCHTYEINQNENDGWIRIYLQEGTTYTIGMIGSPNDFDEFIWLYDNNHNEVSSNDDATGNIDNAYVESIFSYTTSYTGEYFIKIGSYANNNQNFTATVHCEPAPVNQNSGGGESGGGGGAGPELIEIDDNCYVMEIQIENPGGYIEIHEDWWSEFVGFYPAIDWGDNNLESDFGDNVFTHYYQSSGTYKIIWRHVAVDLFNYVRTGDYCKIKNVSQLSYNRSNYDYLFETCDFSDNAEVNFRNVPDYISSVSDMFNRADGVEITVKCESNTTKIHTFQNMFRQCGFRKIILSRNLYHDAMWGQVQPCYTSMFSNSQSLETVQNYEDNYPMWLPRRGDMSYMFENCYNFYIGTNGYWSDLPWILGWTQPYYTNYGWTRNVYKMFYQCYTLQGIVDQYAFWNHSEADNIYTNHSYCFYGCNRFKQQ